MYEKRICLSCKKEFLFRNFLSRIGRGKFCSRLCKTNYFKGKHLSPSTEFKKGYQEGTKNLKKWRDNGGVPKNKGLHIQTNSGKTHFKEGHIPANIGMGKWTICKNCGKSFYHWRKGRDTKFCSRECFYIYNVGKNNSKWKGVSELKDRIRGLSEYKNWRRKIFERDNFTCRECGTKGCYIEAHHIKEFYLILKNNNIKILKQAKECKELWDINNGLTLCKKCHNLTKKGGGYE